MIIRYLVNIRMPTERAHGAQVAHMCAAFARLGHEVELIVPDRHTSITESVAEYYGLPQSFTVTKLSVVDTVSWGRIGFFIESAAFAFAALRHVRRQPAAVLYGRDEIVLGTITFFTKSAVVWESHTGAWNWCARYVAKRARALVVITQGLKDFYVARGVFAQKITVAHDGVDLDAFSRTESKEVARARLGIPADEKVALYVGDLGSWKGTDVLCQAAEKLALGTRVVIIGGEESRLLEAMRQQYPRVLFLGARPYRELPDNLAAGDVLVLPNTAKDKIAVSFTSPLKLFAYMAAEKPIVASDMPSVREILSEKDAYWFTPDDAADLARAINEALCDPSAAHKAKIAREEVVRYTWEARARSLEPALGH